MRVKSFNWKPLYNFERVENAWKFFKSIVTVCIDNNAPMIEKHVKGKTCPWLSLEIKQSINSRDKALRKARKSKSIAD